MKILMIVERDFPDDDRVKKEAPSLKSAGHKVDIICYTHIGKDRIEDYKGITVIKKRITKFVYKSSVVALKLPFYFAFWEKHLIRHLEMNNYDVIHLHDLTLSKPVYKLCCKFNCMFVLDLHENLPSLLSMASYTKKFPVNLLHSDRQWEEYEKYYVGKAVGLVTVVEEMKERVRPFANGEIAVVENTSDIEELKEYDEAPDKDYITLVYSGGITFHRGLQYVVKGLKLAVEQNKRIRLFILGSGSYETSLREQIQELQIGNHVIFLGMLSHEMMFRKISQSDIALIPHIKTVQSDNSSPNKLSQYMFCGKPILTSNCSSVERVIKETQTGLSYEYDSPEDFRDKLLQLISMMPFDQFRINGKRAVVEKYNWGKSAEELKRLYDKLEAKLK